MEENFAGGNEPRKPSRSWNPTTSGLSACLEPLNSEAAWAVVSIGDVA